MWESTDELAALQERLDASAAGAGRHLADIIDDDRRADAAEVCAKMTGMCLLTVATVTADGRPLAGPVDGYLLHGSLWFSSATDSVRMRHLARRPSVSATYVPGEHFALSVHGRAELLAFDDPRVAEMRQAMLDHYLPIQGPAFAEWVDGLDAVAARIDADKIFAYRAPSAEPTPS